MPTDPKSIPYWQELLRDALLRLEAAEAERDKWEARCVALFWSESVDDATCGEIRAATEQYQAWKESQRAK